MSTRPIVSYLVLAAAAACRHRGGAAPAPEQPPPGEAWLTPEQVRSSGIVVAAVTDQVVHPAVTVGGKVTFDDLRVTHVFSPVTGRVIKILAQPGEKVAKGAPLVVLSSPDIASSGSDLFKAKADLDAAEADYRRQKDLYAAHAGSQKDFEAAQSAWRKALAEHARAHKKSQLLAGSVDSVTQEYTLRAPIAGEVVMRSVGMGMEVQGQYSGGTAVELYTIGDLASVWVLADVYEVDLGRIATGAAVEVSVVSWPKETFQGKVDWISDVLDPATRTAKVRCTLDNRAGRLKPEMYATAAIAVPATPTLAVPRDAILRVGDQTVVFVEKGSAPDGRVRFVRQQIEVDEGDASAYVAVARGLDRRDRVAVKGAILLSGMIA